MEDIVIVTGVLVLRPSDEGQKDGITCDGVIQFRSPAGREKELAADTFEIVNSSDEDEMTVNEESGE